jgi:hypothetical protein
MEQKGGGPNFIAKQKKILIFLNNILVKLGELVFSF